ncbi:MAG: TetR/AcrR family transcriptional regulator [Henriciella sp.]|nr:TetR/AcrR family transcriptional regulator [Henriciella sp.]
MNAENDLSLTETDGRRRRSARNKQLIVAAMVKLIRAGDLDPHAADVAKAAGVGVRTVFRLFEDMDSIYAEVTRLIQAEVMPVVEAPFESEDWTARCFEACERRAYVYERIMMLRISANARRSNSDFLSEDYLQFHSQELDRLVAILPDPVRADKTLVQALDTALSFDVWCRLRRVRGLSADEAKDVVRHMVERLTEDQ